MDSIFKWAPVVTAVCLVVALLLAVRVIETVDCTADGLVVVSVPKRCSDPLLLWAPQFVMGTGE